MKRTPLKRTAMRRRIARDAFRKAVMPTLARRKKQLKKKGTTAAKKAKRYKAYLSSPAWKAKRQEVLERDGHRCTQLFGAVRCVRTEHLTVHHKTYARFGREWLQDLTTLCRPCHEAIERTLRPWNTLRNARGE